MIYRRERMSASLVCATLLICALIGCSNGTLSSITVTPERRLCKPVAPYR